MEKGKVDIDLIRRYVRGELSPREMYALERQAEADPMLMDVLRGMEEEPLEVHGSNLADIRSRIAARIGRQQQSTPVRRLAPAARWAVAASILAVFSVGTWWFVREGTAPQQHEAQLAAAPPPPPASPGAGRSADAEAEAPSATASPSATLAEDPGQEAQPPAAAPGASPARQPAAQETRPAVPETSLSARLAAADMADSNTVAPGYGAGRQLAAKSSAARSAAGTLARRSEAEATGNRDVSAIRTTKLTDSVRKDTTSGLLAVASGNEIAKKQGEPAPMGGWPAYLQYLSAAMKPAAGQQGTVRLTFKVDDEGRPAAIKVVETTNEQLNALTTLIVRDGPRWLPGKKDEREVTLTVTF